MIDPKDAEKMFAQITSEQDALRDRLRDTLDSVNAAKIVGKIDGLDVARTIISNQVRR